MDRTAQPSALLSAILFWLGILAAAIFAQSQTPASPIEQRPFAPDAPFSDWYSADIRSLYAILDGSTGVQILSAALREDQDRLYLRIDFVRTPSVGSLLILPSQPAGQSDMPVVIDLASLVSSRESSFKAAPDLTAWWDELLKAAVFRLPQEWANLAPGADLQLTLEQLPQDQPLLYTVPLAHGKPVEPAKVVLIFTDTLTSGTPAQLLRSFDGAHTGPLGQRHGLWQLLETSRQFDVPLILADLARPDRADALIGLGMDAAFAADVREGHLTIPTTLNSADVWPEQSLPEAVSLPEDQRFLYAPLSSPDQAGTAFIFGRLPDRSRMRTWGHLTVIPLPAVSGMLPDGSWQAGPDGLNEALLLQLHQQALRADRAEITVLGGSLPLVTWADSAVASHVFRQLALIPWIEVLDADELLRLPAEPFDSGSQARCADILCAGLPTLTQSLMNDLIALEGRLMTLKDSSLSRSARRAYARMIEPETDKRLWLLKFNAVGPIDRLISAAAWWQGQALANGCNQGINGTDCVLRDEDDLIFLDQRDGSLAAAFHQSGKAVIQWAAPFNQVVNGLGDGRGWLTMADGLLSDPATIPGSFTGLLVDPVSSVYSGTSLKLSDPLGNTIAYELQPAGLVVTLKVAGAENTSLLLYNAAGGKAGTLHCSSLTECRYTSPGFSSSITLDAATAATVDNASESPIYQGHIHEDPNFEYPAGHFLPTGFSLGEIDIEPGMPARIVFLFN